MILLKKKQGEDSYFEFDKILSNGYNIKEDLDRITQKFINGRRKQIRPRINQRAALMGSEYIK